jgi:C-terminal processing protease CtpA/Prc
MDVENHGVAPDIEVELDPAAVRQGHDPQLDKAIEVVMEELREESATGAEAAAVSRLSEEVSWGVGFSPRGASAPPT